MTRGPRDETLDAKTLEQPRSRNVVAERRVPCLTILHHAVLSRIGEECFLPQLLTGQTVEIARASPVFKPPTGSESWPIADPFVSRRPLSIALHDESVTIGAHASTPALVEGTPLHGSARYPQSALDRGITIELQERTILLLHRRNPIHSATAAPSVVGHSEAIERVRDGIARVTDLSFPVLLLGGTGTGKELVARAIHEGSPRRSGPFIAVNVGALPREVAAKELFGSVRGAFSGAVTDTPGYFVRADGGTLFLDEIGETSPEVQVSLLRVLETGTVSPIGDQNERAVDVRVIAATDSDLEGLALEGGFRPALLHRLAGVELRVPKLTERREDIGRLIQHFVRATLEKIGEPERFEVHQAVARPWFPASVARMLIAHDWPGNVRELKNAVQQILIANRGAEELAIDASVEHLFAGFSGQEPRAIDEDGASRRRPADVGEEELLEALGANGWRIAETARHLGISPASLHRLMEQSTRLRRATDLSLDEIVAAKRSAGGNLDRMSADLRVSRRGLQLRMKALGLS